MAQSIVSLFILSISSLCIAFAFEPLYQDFCVADLAAPVSASGPACKNPATAKADDFFFSGFQLPANTSNIYRAGIVPVTIKEMPGLNALGIALARADLGPGGLFPPHIHPRGTEIVTVLEGSLQVGFVTSNPGYAHFTKTVEKGGVFVIPPGLVHYAYNAGKGNVVAIVAWNSQDLGGLTLLPSAIFGSRPDMDTRYLAKSFLLKPKVVAATQAKFN